MPEQLSIIISTIWAIIKNWWWIFLPLLLYRPFLFCWLWWRKEKWMFSQKKALLEIKMPKEVLKPLRAMEQVFSSIWGNVFDPADWWEKWVDGKGLDNIQLEILSLGGVPHFYIRCSKDRRNAIEASIYSQYPDAEISIADDYTKYVPRDVPNKDWELWGTDYELVKPDVFPLKTYSKFFEEKTEAKEEKRVDPVATLLEGMGKLGPGEQLWVQIDIIPITSTGKEAEGGYDFVAEGRKVADKLAKRPEKAQAKSILGGVADLLITGKPLEEEVEREEPLIPVEMKLTPGEREIVAGVEEKVAKRCFKSYIRFIYIAKRDVYFGGAKGIPFGFFNQFCTENLNTLKPWPRTITKIKRYPILDFIRARRLFVRKRGLFFRYVSRFAPLFPKRAQKGVFILNTEELATIFHFPGRMVAPAPFVPRVESKKGEAPPGLPME
jgi:hypothetical protein